jgi:cystathionine beta-lyase/cystathionine gamma-synthase
VRFATAAIHAGQGPDPATGATIVPIYQTSTFTQHAVGVHDGFEYSRSGNPTRGALETCLAALDGGTHALAYASGLAAETGVLSLLVPGDHVVAGGDLYGGTVRLLSQVYAPLGIDTTFVDGAEPSDYRVALRPSTRLVWLETPSNPLLYVTDIAAIARVAHDAGALLAVDNTFATPALQRPLDLGADIAIYSTTKYIGGHSDVVGGSVVVSDATLAERLHFHQNATGSIAGPFDAWLTLRGVKTLQVRMQRHCANAHVVATHLERAEGVERVYFPGLPDHPGHDLAARQMTGFGGMVSVRLEGGPQAAHKFLGALRVFSLAESLGGVESLACYPAMMTHASIPEAERERRGIGGGLVRLSVGIEDAADLLEDLDGALLALR